MQGEAERLHPAFSRESRRRPSPARPQTKAMITAMVKDANNPIRGSTPAMMENKIASGISAKATTSPARTSVRSRRGDRSALRTDDSTSGDRAAAHWGRGAGCHTNSVQVDDEALRGGGHSARHCAVHEGRGMVTVRFGGATVAIQQCTLT